MKPKPFEIIVEFTPQSTKTGITYETHQKGLLIRCKDCKHRYYHELLKQDYCDIPNMQFGEIDPNGYCHRAERKEE